MQNSRNREKLLQRCKSSSSFAYMNRKRVEEFDKKLRRFEKEMAAKAEESSDSKLE